MSRTKGFTKKLFACGLTVIMVVSLWSPIVQATSAGSFTDIADANHWGRSDLRAYLNNGLCTVTENGTLTNKNYRLDSTVNSDNEGGYAAYFTDKEYGLVQPWTYSTNVLSTDGTVVSAYETTDKFVLPSANYSNDMVLSWGNDDISADTTYATESANNKARMIPISYWAFGSSDAWTRSGVAQGATYSMASKRGTCTGSQIVSSNASVASIFKIDSNSIIFASSISAKELAKSEGCQWIDIIGANTFGQKSTSALPDYGMYLKTASNAEFQANRMAYDTLTSTITVDFNGGVAGQYVVGQIYKRDDLELGTTCYGFAKEIPANDTTKLSIDVSSWNLTSLDGYTIKIWMEDATTTNLASATTPNTFYGESGSIGTAGTESQNLRVFAMKNQLQTSWGDLTLLDDTAYQNVLNGAPGTTLVGSNPTNQKIYYGTDSSGNPLQFWIAGRENAEGTISVDGNIICLYQSKAVDTYSFNTSTARYLSAPSVEDFTITLPPSLTYDGAPKEVTVSPKGSVTGMGDVTVKYYDAVGQKLEMAPVYPGTYQVKLDVAEGDSYGAVTDLTDASWTFTIEPRRLEIHSVTVSDKYYDGTASAIVEEVIFNNLYGSDYLMFNTDYEAHATFENDSSGTEKTVTVTITLKDTEGTKYYTFMKDGEKTNTITFNTTAEILEHSDWGTLVEKSGVIQYVDVDGTTSAEITGNDIIWLSETCNGVSTWYGIDNSDGIFETGSRFYIREISTDDTDYTNLAAMVDESNLVILQDDNGKMFQVGVKDSDGAECFFSNQVKLYVQTDARWRIGGETLFIMSGVDEMIAESETQMSAPDGRISCVTFDITHSGFMVICDACCNGTNHTYETAPVFFWSEDNSSCKITLTCADHIGHVDTFDCVVTSVVKKASTCKEMGVTTYTATYENYVTTKDVTDIEKTTEHVWDEGMTIKEATTHEDGSKQFVCTVCGEVKTETIAAIGLPETGKVLEDTLTNATYKVTKSSATGGTVQYIAPKNEKQELVTIPASITVDGITYKVTSIAKDTFKSNRYITTVKIGKNVTTIGANAFYNCKKLKSVSVGGKVTTIEDKAFYKCIALTKITIPSKVKKIGKYAFYGCKKLKTITIKTTKLTTKNVGKNAFKYVGSKYYKKVVVKVPKKKLKSYKTMLKKRGLNSKATVKK